MRSWVHAIILSAKSDGARYISKKKVTSSWYKLSCTVNLSHLAKTTNPRFKKTLAVISGEQWFMIMASKMSNKNPHRQGTSKTNVGIDPDNIKISTIEALETKFTVTNKRLVRRNLTFSQTYEKQKRPCILWLSPTLRSGTESTAYVKKKGTRWEYTLSEKKGEIWWEPTLFWTCNAKAGDGSKILTWGTALTDLINTQRQEKKKTETFNVYYESWTSYPPSQHDPHGCASSNFFTERMKSVVHNGEGGGLRQSKRAESSRTGWKNQPTLQDDATAPSADVMDLTRLSNRAHVRWTSENICRRRIFNNNESKGPESLTVQ